MYLAHGGPLTLNLKFPDDCPPNLPTIQLVQTSLVITLLLACSHPITDDSGTAKVFHRVQI